METTTIKLINLDDVKRAMEKALHRCYAAAYYSCPNVPSFCLHLERLRDYPSYMWGNSQLQVSFYLHKPDKEIPKDPDEFLKKYGKPIEAQPNWKNTECGIILEVEDCLFYLATIGELEMNSQYFLYKSW